MFNNFSRKYNLPYDLNNNSSLYNKQFLETELYSFLKGVLKLQTTSNPAVKNIYNEKGNMDKSLAVIVALLSSLAAFLVMVALVALCFYCCRQSRLKKEQLKWSRLSTTDEEAKRSDVVKLSQHSVDARAKKPPKLKSLRLEAPPPHTVQEPVQPTSYAQVSLMKTLGVAPDKLPTRNNVSEKPSDLPATSQPLLRRTTSAIQEFFSSGSSPTEPDEDLIIPPEPPSPDDSPTSNMPLLQRTTSAIQEFFTGGDNENEHKLGLLQFNLAYDFHASNLIITIIQAKDLPAKDFSGSCDPYVRVCLLPDKKHRMDTKIKKKTKNPQWNESLYFEGFPHNKLRGKILHLQVIDYDRFSRDDPIGEVHLPLCEVNLSNSPTLWRPLKPSVKAAKKTGELLLSLCYHPASGKLVVVVMKAKDLKAADFNNSSDPYVKIWLLHASKRIEKKKTAIKKKTLNPVYNESFIFLVPIERIRDTELEIFVMDHDKLSRNDCIGRLILSSQGGPTEVKHWGDMLAKPRQPIAQWHSVFN